MAKSFDLHIRVATAQLATTIVQLLDGEAQLLDMKQTDEPARHPNKRHVFANGKRFKGISGNDLVLQVVADGKPHKYEEIKRAFVSKGFADTSHQAAISNLKADGKIFVSNGVVQKK